MIIEIISLPTLVYNLIKYIILLVVSIVIILILWLMLISSIGLIIKGLHDNTFNLTGEYEHTQLRI